MPTLRTMVVYMFFSFLQLAPGSRDLSQAEKERNNGKAKQIHKMATIFTQNDNFLHQDQESFISQDLFWFFHLNFIQLFSSGTKGSKYQNSC